MGNDYKLGLVLSGGGARGAYEAGVARYLAEVNVEPDMYAGASVGALNGAFLAASSSIKDGAKRLEDIWHSLSKEQMVQLNSKSIGVAMLYNGFGNMAGSSTRSMMDQLISKGLTTGGPTRTIMDMLDNSPLEAPVERGLVDNGPLERLLQSNVTNTDLENGKPLWISLYESRGSISDLAELGLSSLGMKDTRESDYIHLQSLNPEERIKALLASAALPLAYDNQKVNGKTYRDGGIGQSQSSKGNTPLEPLVKQGCTHAIVVHLKHGSMWDRHAYPNTNIIEVRPKASLYDEGQLKSMLNFDSGKISYLIDRGYQDAKRCVGDVLEAIKLNHAVDKSIEKMQNSVERLHTDGFDEKMKEL